MRACSPNLYKLCPLHAEQSMHILTVAQLGTVRWPEVAGWFSQQVTWQAVTGFDCTQPQSDIVL